MSLHAKGLLPGSVPVNWLNEHVLFKCSDCNNLVAESHRSSHQVKCTHLTQSCLVVCLVMQAPFLSSLFLLLKMYASCRAP